MNDVCSINNLTQCLLDGGMSPDLANLLGLLGRIHGQLGACPGGHEDAHAVLHEP